MEHKGGVLHGHHLHLVEPGVDGGFRQLGPQPVQHVFHTSAIEFNESAPFPRIMRFLSLFQAK